MADLATGTQEVAATGNPSDPVIDTKGTESTGGEASRQSATVQESFIPQGLDINTLPPNIRAQVEKINADMVRGFTEKTTKLSETIKSESQKASEAFKQKAEQYDQFLQQEEFVKQWNEFVQKTNNATPQNPGNPDDPVNQLKTQMQEVTQKIALAELSQVTNGFADAVNEKGEKLHPDFDKFNGITLGALTNNGQKDEYSLLRACVELSPGNTPSEKLANGYKQAKSFYDSIFEEGKKAGMGRLQTKVLNGSQPPTSVSGNLSVTESRPKNAAEALEMARRGQMVSR